MLLHAAKMLLGPLAWRLLVASCRCNPTRVPPGPAREPVIFACLHRDILPAILHCRPARPHLLISKSPDGEILIRTLRRDGFGFVRGSTGHDGKEGYVGLLRVLRQGHHVGVAVDGPRGPFGEVRPGALLLAKGSGAPIVPLTVHCERPWVLGTWDRTVVPRPGSLVTVTPGSPVRLARDADPADLEAARRLLADRLGTTGETDRGSP